MPAAASLLPQRTQPPASAALAWFGTVAVAFGTGFGAVYLQEKFAPVGVFPLLVGAISGSAVGGVWIARGGAAKRTLLLAGLIGGFVTSATLHYGSYYAVRRDDERRRVLIPPMVLLADPSRGEENPQLRTFAAFVEREWRRGRNLGSHHVSGAWLGLWWALDAAAIIGMAAIMAKLVAGPTERPVPNYGDAPAPDADDRGETT